MLGLGSAGMAMVFWLCLASAATCIIYGIVNWNKSGKADNGTNGGGE